LLTVSRPEGHDAACVKSASSAQVAPLTFFPLGKLRRVHSQNQPLIKNKDQIMKILRLFVAFTLICVAFLPAAQAVVPPPPGGYSNFTTAAGDHALQALTLGVGNTAIGTFSLFSVTAGNFNTAVGAGSLDLNLGDSNTATGAAALLFNTTGTENTAHGTAALEFNETGNFNTATGAFALFSNTIGVENTATGDRALFSNGTGATGDGNLQPASFNSAFGSLALQSNIDGSVNSAFGWNALAHNTSGSSNTAIGAEALENNTVGLDNTSTGSEALISNTTGNDNTAIGFRTLKESTEGIRNTAIGAFVLQNNHTGDLNVALGFAAGNQVETADNVICIGANVTGANVSNSCFIGQIRGVTTALNDAIPVVIASNGQLGTQSSSARFKKDIKAMDKTSEAILALKPVTFHYKSDERNRPEFGLIAEEVAEVNPDLIVRDENGQIYTVRYDAVNAMLLNEFLKEHRKNEEQEAIIAALKSTDAQQQKQIDALTAVVQKVSAQVELSKAAPQTVLNER
jgi:hypothetical protein